MWKTVVQPYTVISIGYDAGSTFTIDPNSTTIPNFTHNPSNITIRNSATQLLTLANSNQDWTYTGASGRDIDIEWNCSISADIASNGIYFTLFKNGNFDVTMSPLTYTIVDSNSQGRVAVRGYYTNCTSGDVFAIGTLGCVTPTDVTFGSSFIVAKQSQMVPI
jgi:hypothetical protein